MPQINADDRRNDNAATILRAHKMVTQDADHFARAQNDRCGSEGADGLR
jgi:hypothetical protein